MKLKFKTNNSKRKTKNNSFFDNTEQKQHKTTIILCENY